MKDGRKMEDRRLRGAARIIDGIRGQIIRGALCPGAAIPSHLSLAKRYGISTVAVQNGLNALSSQGFVEARPRVGTFVAKNPPHLNDYALVFCSDPALAPPASGRSWTRYHVALTNEALRLQKETGKRILHFHGIDEHADSEDRVRLESYVESQRVAGIIFTTAPFLLRGSPILTQPGIPRVAVSSAPEPGVDMLVVNYDFTLWYAKALDFLAGQGRRRVATLGLSSATGHHLMMEACLRRLLPERGMLTKSRWLQLASIRNPDTARRICELLMADHERPDGLLITDDNFVEPALAGIAAAGIRMPEDLDIVAHANFPWTPSLALSARLLGYDIGSVLRTCIEHIDLCRRGESDTAVSLVQPVWHEEYVRQADGNLNTGARLARSTPGGLTSHAGSTPVFDCRQVDPNQT